MEIPKSQSREGSCVTDDWRPAPECPRTLEELEAILKARNEAALAHEKSLAFAFAQQVPFNTIINISLSLSLYFNLQ